MHLHSFPYQRLEQLDVKHNVSFVIHDWRSALDFLWSYYKNENPNAVKGTAFMEAVVAPFDSRVESLQETFDLFKLLRGLAGEEIILCDNPFAESLPCAFLRNLNEKDIAEYGRSLLNSGEDHGPILRWPTQNASKDEPADVDAWTRWIAGSPLSPLSPSTERERDRRTKEPVNLWVCAVLRLCAVVRL